MTVRASLEQAQQCVDAIDACDWRDSSEVARLANLGQWGGFGGFGGSGGDAQMGVGMFCVGADDREARRMLAAAYSAINYAIERFAARRRWGLTLEEIESVRSDAVAAWSRMVEVVRATRRRDDDQVCA